jgi:hypothetical protein
MAEINLDDPKGRPAKRLWFSLNDEEAGPEAVRTFQDIDTSLQGRRLQMLRQARVWANSWLGSLFDLASARLDRKSGPWNVCSAAVSTAMSMVCRSPVKITLETSNAEYTVQRLARDATRWFYGVLADNKIAEDVGPNCFRDACVVDVGVAVVRVVDKKLQVERVFPDEVIVSETESMYGNPYQIGIKTYRPKHEILARYGKRSDKKREAIERIAIETPGNGSATGYQAGLIPIYECWARNGKHLVAVTDCTLECEPWEYDFLPLVPLYIEAPPAGYYGRGYVQQLLGYQLELFSINDAIDEHIQLFTSAKWVLEANSGIDPSDLDNEIGGILTKNKGADNPHLLVGQIPTDLLQEREKVYNRALEEIGLSSWSISGQEPASRSGIAMQTARDKEHGRLLTPGLAYEAWHVRLAEVCFALGDKTAGTSYAGKGPADKSLEAVDFRKISRFLSDQPWKVRPYPIGALPDNPDARRQTVEGWMKMGLITGTVAQSLLELPDVDAEASLVSAAREDILWSIEEILTKGRAGYVSPEILQDLALGQRMFAAAWLKGRRQGVEEDKLDLLQRWINEAIALQKPPAAPAAPEIRPGVGEAPSQVEPISVDGQGGGGPPPALPGAPPEGAPAPEVVPPPGVGGEPGPVAPVGP